MTNRVSSTQSIIEDVFETECDLRVIRYRSIESDICQIITLRVHFNDMRFCTMKDEDILDEVKRRIPECVSVIYDDNDHVGNKFVVVISKGGK